MHLRVSHDWDGRMERSGRREMLAIFLQKSQTVYVFFFGYDRPEPGCCLQQWYFSPFSAGGRQFHTAEQYIMSHKTLLMGDTEFAERIAEVDTPAKAKQLGREVRKFQQRIWNGNCDRVVEEGNYAKFEQNGKLKVVSVGYETESIG